MLGECIVRMNFVDSLRQRLGRQKLVAYGGCLATLSCFIATMSEYYGDHEKLPIATIAYFFLGVGCAPLVPVAFSSSGHASENTSAALSTVAFCTDFGSIVGPLIIGAASSLLGSLQKGMLFASCLIGLTIIVGLNMPSDPEDYKAATKDVAQDESISSLSSVTAVERK